MSADSEDRLMQRAVDGELTNDQRRELLEHCGQDSDRWKTLACAFLEDQLVARAVNDRPLLHHSDEDATPARPVRPAERASLQWYQHPAVAIPLTMCTAFLLGLLVPWDVLSERGSSAETNLVQPFIGASPADWQRRSEPTVRRMDRADPSSLTDDELDALNRQMREIRQILYELKRDQFMNDGLESLYPLVVPSE